MATVTLSAAFNTENLWAPRLAGASLKTSTVYEFQSAFGFVRVTGDEFHVWRRRSDHWRRLHVDFGRYE